MPGFRIQVVASYVTVGPHGPVARAVRDWAQEFARRSDPAILNAVVADDDQPVAGFVTMTVLYEIDAPSEPDARTDALSAFRRQSENLPSAQSLAAQVADEDVE